MGRKPANFKRVVMKVPENFHNMIVKNAEQEGLTVPKYLEDKTVVKNE
jgi:hypothetical protein